MLRVRVRQRQEAAAAHARGRPTPPDTDASAGRAVRTRAPTSTRARCLLTPHRLSSICSKADEWLHEYVKAVTHSSDVSAGRPATTAVPASPESVHPRTFNAHICRASLQRVLLSPHAVRVRRRRGCARASHEREDILHRAAFAALPAWLETLQIHCFGCVREEGLQGSCWLSDTQRAIAASPNGVRI